MLRISQGLEQVSQRGCSVSVPLGFQDPAGENPEQPDLSFQVTLLWAYNLSLFTAFCKISPLYMVIKERKENFSRNFQTKQQCHMRREHSVYEWEAMFENMMDMIILDCSIYWWLYDYTAPFTHVLSLWQHQWCCWEVHSLHCWRQTRPHGSEC